MKSGLIFLLIFFAVSCEEDHPEATALLSGEWQWVMTTFDTRGTPLIAEELDATYYYHFGTNGILEIRASTKALRQQLSYSISTEGSPDLVVLPDLNQSWGYRIKNDTLLLWETASLFPRMDHFKKIIIQEAS